MTPSLNLASEELLGHLPALQVRQTGGGNFWNIPEKGASQALGPVRREGPPRVGEGPRGYQHSQACGGRCQEGQEQEAGQGGEDRGDDDHTTTASPWPRVDGGWRLPCAQQPLRGCPVTPGQSLPPPRLPLKAWEPTEPSLLSISARHLCPVGLYPPWPWPLSPPF